MGLILSTYFKIRGDKWKVFVLTDKAYREKCGSGSHAVTFYRTPHDPECREINFRDSKYCFNTLIHELVHAHLSYRNFEKNSHGQVEEMFCDEMGARAASMLRSARIIDAKVRKALRA